MNFNYFLGIDTSKLKLAYALITAQGQVLARGEIDNTPVAIRTFLRHTLKTDYGVGAHQLLICAENTGLYTNPLRIVTTNLDFFFWQQDALELKLSSGRQRGKTDLKDALTVARYAHRYADQAQRFKLPSKSVRRLKEVSRQRTALLRDITAWKVRLAENRAFAIDGLVPEVDQLLKQHIKHGEELLKKLDKVLNQLIKADKRAKRKYDIARSVPGFGPKNTLTLMAETELFDKTPTGKACASYAGLTPDRYESGTSVKRSSRTTKACNKRLKTAIHLGAMSLLKHDNIYRRLYDRLRQRGRKHLQAVNAVRNKMVRVLFACLRSDSMYQKNLHQSLNLP